MNACPSREQLMDFTIGELDDETAGRIAQHVDTCTRCQTSLEEIDDEADLRVAALLAPPGKSPYADDPEFQRALAEIQSIDLKQPYKTKEVIQNPGFSQKPVPSNLVEIGQYRLLAKLGEGGMGAVYKALHTKLDKLVALKILPRERTRDPQAVARFEREMKAVGRLEHPFIVRAMDANEQDGTHYLVMEYVDGVDLSELVRHIGPLRIADACEIIHQAAGALEHAHANGLIHRDIKPSNIMLSVAHAASVQTTTQTDARDKQAARRHDPSVKLLDLGLARLQEHAVEDLTSTGQAMGTLDYMAPEQCDDSHAVDARADIYSLGATLYKLLTGHAPFSGSQFNTPTKKLAALLTKPTPPIRDRRSGVPEQLAEIIHRLLAKDPDQRPATAGEVAELLAPYTEEANLIELVNQLPQETTEMMTDATTLARPDALDAPHHGTDEYLSSSMTETHPGRLKEKAPSGATGSASAVVAPGNQQVREKDEAMTPDEASEPVPGTPRSFPDLGHEPDRSSSQPSARRRILPPRMAVALAAGLIGVIALGVILYINTDHGRLVIDTKVDDVKVIVESGGGKVTIIDPQAERTVNLSPGEYDVRLEDEKAGLALSTKSFTMRRGKEVVVEVRYEPKVAKREPTKPDRPPIQPSVGQWKPGPAENVMVGVLPRPAKLPGIRRWQIETAMPRSDILSVAYSPDGQVIACGTRNGQVRLYDAETMQLIRLLSLHKDEVSSVAWSPDGHWLASASRDHTVRLWKKDGTPGPVLQHEDSVYAVCWSPDGEQLASGGRGTVRLWNVEGTARQIFPTQEYGLYSVAWSPDGKWIATGHYNSTVSLWTADGTLVKVLEGHEDHVQSVAWSPDSQTLASGSQDGTVRLWSADGTAGKVLKATSNVHDVAWSPDGKWLAAASVGAVNLWTTDGKAGPVFGHRGNVFSVAWSPDGNHIVTGEDNSRIQIWDASGEQKNPPSTISGHQPKVESVAFSPDGEQLASGGYDRMVRVWSTDGTMQAAFKGHGSRNVYSVAWRPDGSRLASGGQDHTVRIWQKDGTPASVLKHGDEVQAVAWHPDGQRIASGGFYRDQTVYLWNLNDKEQAQLLEGHEHLISSVAWAPDGEFLASGSRDNTIRLWNLDATPGPVLEGHNAGVSGIAWRPDGQMLASVGGGDLRLWSPDGSPLDMFKTGGHTQSVAWNPDGQRLVTATQTSARLWQIDGTPGPILQAHRLQLQSVDWSSSGRQIASGSSDGTIIVWDAKAHQPEWVGVSLNDGQAATFTAAGQLLHGDPELIEKEFVYVIETDEGKLELLSRSDFLQRVESTTAPEQTTPKSTID